MVRTRAIREPLLQLPYYADSSTLPAPLPTMKEIEKHKELGTGGLSRTIRVNKHFIVKCGDLNTITEAENILFVANNTGIRVPKVYAAFWDDTICPWPVMWGKSSQQVGNVAYLIMEFIPGQTLWKLWDSLGVDEKTSIFNKLKPQIDELRAIPSPGWFGSHGKQPFTNCPMLSMDEGHSGPFETEAEFAKGMVHKLRSIKSNIPLRFPPEIFEQGLLAVLEEHPSVFTHSNLRLDNILLVPAPEHGDGKAEFELIIKGWAEANWFPRWFEYASAMWKGGPRELEWKSMVNKLLEPHYKELAWLTIVSSPLQYGG